MKNFNINQAVVLGMICEPPGTVNLDMIKPLIKIYPVSEQKIDFTPLPVLFSDNETARKCKGLKEGDIMLIYGILGYDLDYGYFLHATSFVMLSKNKQNIPEKFRRPICFEFTDIPNTIILAGRINNVMDDTINLTVDRENFIRGDIWKSDVIPIPYEDKKIDFQEMDNLIFIGNIDDGKLKGQISKTIREE